MSQHEERKVADKICIPDQTVDHLELDLYEPGNIFTSMKILNQEKLQSQ
jgi:hypothetical protein